MTATNPTGRTLRGVDGLIAAGLLPATAATDGTAAVAARYAVAVTPAVVAAMARPDRDDPVGRQYLPDPAELDRRPEERDDPIGDGAHRKLRGLVHRYPDRVLLMPVEVCAVYCRFCFRREAVGPGAKALTDADIDAAIAYVAARPAIFEVILTGGDPLLLPPPRLTRLLARLAAIPHLGAIRIHSRIPVADPGRVDPALLAALAATGDKALFLAVHCNHAQELTAPARAALARLAGAGIVLLGQSVLLRGVNDTVEALETLLRALVANRVKPYYLHQLDHAPGTSHFRVPLAEGRALMRALRGRLTGLAQPTYVLDIPDGWGKVPLTGDWLEPGEDDTVTVRDWQGQRHLYR
jgi:lysine 2,3-aminomutase